MSSPGESVPLTTSTDTSESDKPLITPRERTPSVQHIVIPEEELLEIPPSTYSCELCGQSVKTKANLRAHHIKTHKILKNEADVAFFTKQKKQVTYIYHCPFHPCKHNVGFDAGFSTCSRLKQHYQNVHMQKTLKCERCGDLFSTPSSHAYHLRYCGNVFTCPVCSRHYSLKKHLGQHFRRTGHRPDTGNGKRVNGRTYKNGVFKMPRLLEPAKDAESPYTTLKQDQLQHSSVPIVLPIIILPVPVFATGPFGLSTQPNTDTILQHKPAAQLPITLPSGVVLPTSFGSMLNANYVTSFLHSMTNATTHPIDLDASDQFEAIPAVTVSAPLVDSETQTEVSVPSQGSADATTTTSVNTCTDEDDITAFIGSLFCDASVDTNFPPTDITTEFVGEPSSIVNLDTLQSSVHNPVDLSTSETMESMTADSYLNFKTSNPVKLSTFSVMDEEVQTNPMGSFENVAMQTDCIQKAHVSADTCDHPSLWTRNPHLRASLETPPPPVTSSDHARVPSEQLTNLSSRSDRFTSVASEAPRVQEHPLSPISALLSPPQPYSPCVDINQNQSQSSEYVSPEYTDRDRFNKPYLSSHSIGLQSSPWPASRSSMETQTLSDDLESWLNSVHTQTSSSMFGLTSFADISVGVDEDFLTAALATVEGEK